MLFSLNRINRYAFGLLGLLLLLGSPTRGFAIAVENLATSEAAPVGSSFNWDYVYNYKGSSASAVDHYWILTAAHVADDGGSGNLSINGITYVQQEVVFHSQATDPDGHLTADIALVRYDKPLPGYYLLADSVPVGSEVMICGFGYAGDVISTFSSAYFTETGGGHTTKRWGTNIIDAEITRSSTLPIVVTSKGFDISISRDRRNAGKTTYEAGCNIYDSGSGMFYEDNGTWKLVGHMIARLDNGQNFTGNFAVAVKYYTAWIKSVIVDYDSDMDGLPDWWEAAFGSMTPEADPDQDGFTNYEEWLADTVPTNGQSFLSVAAQTNALAVGFESSSNRSYQVQFRTDLLDTNQVWMTEVDWFDGSPSQTVQAVTLPGTHRFYRVRAKLR